MGLFSQSGVYVNCWIQMREDVTARYEIDATNDRATLFFGTGDDYVLDLDRDGLGHVASMASRAIADLAAAAAEPRPDV